MSETLKVRKNEVGVVRLFTVDTEAEGPNMISAEPDWGADLSDPPWPLREALGVEYLDSDFIELFDVAVLDELGLAGYMIEGLGIAEEDVVPHRAQLDAINGLVLIVFSYALGGYETSIRPKSPLRWVGTFVEDRPPVQFDPLPSGGAERPPVPEKKPPSDAAMSGRVATVALLVLLALTAVMVWVAS